MAEILFAVMTSRATRERAASVSSSWCASDGAHCRFFADAPSGLAADGLRHWSTIKSAAPKKPCCKRGKAGAGFFCSAHRSRTLAAQYRYLPALRLARRSELVASGRVQWVVLLDDDLGAMEAGSATPVAPPAAARTKPSPPKVCKPQLRASSARRALYCRRRPVPRSLTAHHVRA